MIRTILVGLDGSPRESDVFDAAGEMATRFNATLTLFRALLVPPEFPPAAATSHGDLLPAHLVEGVRIRMIALASRTPGLAVAFRIDRASQPWRAILRAGDELDVDLLVLGSHGYYGVDRLLGTTAAKVANLAKRNVLVVHTRELTIKEDRSPAPAVPEGHAR